MWPFKAKVETRASATEMAIQSAMNAAGNVQPTPAATAAAALAAGMMGRGFAAADVAPSEERTGLTPTVMRDIGQALIYHGEYLAVIFVIGGRVVLQQASSWDVNGTSIDPMAWRYTVDLPTPDGQITSSVPAEGVIHIRIGTDPASPWRGVSPLVAAGHTAAAHAAADLMLRDELNGPHWYALPLPISDMGEERINSIASDMATKRGRTRIVPSALKDWSSGERMGGGEGWTPKRIGADPPSSVIDLRDRTYVEVLAACGIPATLFAIAQGTGQAAREAVRLLIHTTLGPLGKVVADECSAKLDTAVSFDFDALASIDLLGRARSFQSMVAAGVPVEQAVRTAGLVVGE